MMVTVKKRVRCIDDSGQLGQQRKLIAAGEVYDIDAENECYYHIAGTAEHDIWYRARFRDVASEEPSANASDGDALMSFFSAPADPTFCKCNTPKVVCKFHRD